MKMQKKAISTTANKSYWNTLQFPQSSTQFDMTFHARN